jgi:exoribonuclease R
MNYIFKIKKGEAVSELKGYITEITEKYIKVYIPYYELEEKIFIDDRHGYSKLKKIEFIKEENQIIKLKIDEKEYNLYEEREIKVWVFIKEDNFFNKIKVEIL